MTSLIPVHKWTCITTSNNGKHKTTQKKFLPTHMKSHGGHRAREQSSQLRVRTGRRQGTLHGELGRDMKEEEVIILSTTGSLGRKYN